MTLHKFIAQNVEKKLQFPEDFRHGLRLPVIPLGKYHDGNFANFHGRILFNSSVNYANFPIQFMSIRSFLSSKLKSPLTFSYVLKNFQHAFNNSVQKQFFGEI